MYFNVNFNVIFKIKKVDLLVSELYQQIRFGSKYSTVPTSPSLTTLDHSPPHIPAMYITPHKYTPNNNF